MLTAGLAAPSTRGVADNLLVLSASLTTNTSPCLGPVGSVVAAGLAALGTRGARDSGRAWSCSYQTTAGHQANSEVT